MSESLRIAPARSLPRRPAPRRFGGAVLAAALLAADGGGASGQAEGDPWREARKKVDVVRCDDRPSEYPQVAARRGDFLGGGREVRLALWNVDPGCRIGRADGEGRSAQLGGVEGDWAFVGGAWFVAVCRDPASGRDRAIVHMSQGQYHDIAVWALEPPPAPPKLLYDEAWGDSVYGESDEWGIDLLVAADGACLWRERKRRFDAYDAAMAALRIDRGAESEDGESDDARSGPLRWREIAAGEARARLAALRGIARFEGAVYADAAARERWLVVQILGGAFCDAEGAVLLLERKTGRWKSIYDVPTGCSKAWNYPMRGMVVAGDRLYAGLCIDCMYWGSYADFEIDLHALRAVYLDGRADTPGPHDGENPELGDIAADAFPE